MEARIANLERGLRRWRALSIVALGLGLSAVLIAARPYLQGEVRARGFGLLNDRDEVVARLGFDDQGEPQLGFKLLKNKGTIMVGALAEDIGGVAVLGERAKIMIATDATGSPYLSVQAGQRSVALGVQGKNEPTLLMINGQTNLSATASGIRMRQPSGDVLLLPEPNTNRSRMPAKATKP